MQKVSLTQLLHLHIYTTVTDELKEILKPHLYCKYRNGWVIKDEQSEMFFHKKSHIDYDFKPKRKLNIK